MIKLSFTYQAVFWYKSPNISLSHLVEQLLDPLLVSSLPLEQGVVVVDVKVAPERDCRVQVASESAIFGPATGGGEGAMAVGGSPGNFEVA